MLSIASGPAIGQPVDFRYSSNFEHLQDEMKWLDCLIRLKLLEQDVPAAPADRFKGLLLSKAEVEALVAEGPIHEDEQVRSAAGSERQAAVSSMESLESLIAAKKAASLEADIFLALPRVREAFNLTPFEARCLLVCLAPEIDRKYDSLFAYLQDDITCKKPSVALLLKLLCATLDERLVARQAFDPRAPLLKYRLLHITESSFDGPATLLSRTARLDDHVVNFLLGVEQTDSQLEGIARLICTESCAGSLPVDEAAREQIKQFIRSPLNRLEKPSSGPVFFFFGPQGAGKQALAEAVCSDLRLRLLVADVSRMLDAQPSFDEAVWRLGREAAVQNAALCLEEFDVLLADDSRRACLNSLLEMIDAVSQVVFLLGSRNRNLPAPFNRAKLVHLDFPAPDDRERKQLWEGHLRECGLPADDIEARALASSFKLTAGQIQAAVSFARNLAQWRAPEDARMTIKDLYAGCSAQADLRLGALARRIEPVFEWDDIVLPPDQLAQLREICDQVGSRHTVYADWGFGKKLALGRGVTALFSGPPGTGKTMAAEVIANALRLNLYKIDLSQVVSKYIGETEKNLHQVFNGAQSSGAILFFDEADALFGKRSEVKEAHDRYANIEVAYLLQKMEEYDGIAILATNLRQNLDAAFARRMRFIIEFPFPDEEYRRRIWEGLFPRQAPVSLGAGDLDRLSREIGLAGANLRNIALAAASYAASENAAIQMSHVLRAARREYQKLGRA
jgi:SpoVK/Ycf46/Vps4 family AAA+-type ATPase